MFLMETYMLFIVLGKEKMHMKMITIATNAESIIATVQPSKTTKLFIFQNFGFFSL